MKTKKNRNLLIEQYVRRNGYVGDAIVVERHIRDLEWYAVIRLMFAVMATCFTVSLLVNFFITRGDESFRATALRSILSLSAVSFTIMSPLFLAQYLKVSVHKLGMDVSHIAKKFITGRKVYKKAFGRSLKNCRDYLDIGLERERAMCDLTEQAEGAIRSEKTEKMRMYKAAHYEMFDAAKEMLGFSQAAYNLSYEVAKDLVTGTMPDQEFPKPRL